MISPSLNSLFWYQGKVLSGFSLNGITDTNQVFNGYFEQGAASDGDSIEFLMNLKPGSYVLHFIGVRSSDGALIDLFFDDVFSATFDMSGAGLNNFSQNKNFTVTNDITKIKFTVNGTNSGGFVVKMSQLYAIETIAVTLPT